MPGPRYPQMPGMPRSGAGPYPQGIPITSPYPAPPRDAPIPANVRAKKVGPPPIPNRARRLQDSHGKVGMRTQMQRDSEPERLPPDNRPKPLTAKELSDKAKVLGLCGLISQDLDVCTLRAEHSGRRHEQRQIGGPQDGRCMAWWRETNGPTIVVADTHE